MAHDSEPIPDDSPLREGAVLNGRYRVARALGEGGFGAVYEAVHLHTGRAVAVKALHPHLLRHAASRQRFLREARAATRIAHEHVVEVLDLDLDAATGAPFIVQELLVGETLLERLEALPGQRMSPAEALRVMLPVLDALGAAHACGVVHRDLKPNNIFLARDRRGREVPKVIDFGIAKVLEEPAGSDRTATGALVGTPTHMSPEQALGTPPIDALTDVWAVGVVLYECLSGRLPYEAENVQQVLGMIQYREPVPLGERDPALPADLVAAVEGALQRDRARRHPTMAAFLDALRRTSTAASLRDERAPTDPAPAPMSDRGAPAPSRSARTLSGRPPAPSVAAPPAPSVAAPPARRGARGWVAAGLLVSFGAAAAAGARARHTPVVVAAPRVAESAPAPVVAPLAPVVAPPAPPLPPATNDAPQAAAPRPIAPRAARARRAPPRARTALSAPNEAPAAAASSVALAPEVQWRP